MKKAIILLLLLPILSFNFFCNTNPSKDAKAAANKHNEQKFASANDEDDASFITEAASGGLMEVQLGQLAQQNGASPKVKEFGMNMITDHTKANDELKELAAKKNITIPLALSEKHQQHVTDLSKKKGPAFDKEYIELMVKDHEEDVNKFQKEAEKGKDAEIKAFAMGKITILQHHLNMCQTIKDAIKN